MRTLSVLALSLAVLSVPVAAQCLPTVSVPDSDPTTSAACNVIPFGTTPSWNLGYTMANVIPASFMPGSNQNPYVVDVGFAPCGTGDWVCSTVVIGIGHIPNPLPNPFSFPTVDPNTGILTGVGSFNDLTLLHNSYGAVNGFPFDTPYTTTGTFTWNVTQDTWSPLGYAAGGGTGFMWNGTDNVAWFITYQNSLSTNGWSGSCRRENLQPRYFTSGYNMPGPSSSSSTGLKIQLLLSQGPGLPAIPTWQCNQPSSSVDVNGAPDPGPNSPMVASVGAGCTATINFGGLGGQPFDLAITSPELGVPVGGGGFLTGSGLQAINIDLFAPSLAFLYNGTFTNAFTPYSAFVSSPVPVSFAFQQVVIDPANPDVLALSHLNELNWVTCGGVSENWDSLPTGLGVAPVGWTNPGAPTTSAWTVRTGGTPSSNTGPTSAFNGPNYAYCETSGNSNTTFTFDTCGADITTLTNGILSFELSAIGATIGTLNVYQGDGCGNFGMTPIFTQTGAEPGQAQNGVEWTYKSVIPTFNNPTIDFRFEYISGSSFTGDLAIDDIMLN